MSVFQNVPRYVKYLLVVMLAVPSAASAAHYELLIQNRVEGGEAYGQPFSRPVAIVHGTEFNLFEPGGSSSLELELLAREGDPTLLLARAQVDPFVRSVTVGDGPFFDEVSMSVEAEPGDYLTIVWMLGRTNDLFSAIRNVLLPDVPLEVSSETWDSGTEENSGLAAHIPFYGYRNAGAGEDASIAIIPTFSVLDDPQYGRLDWVFPPTANVVIYPVLGTPVEETSWGKVKTLFE